MDPVTVRRLLAARILERMAELDDMLGPAAKDTSEYAYLIRWRDELRGE